jgi:hypothetical protein
MGTSQSQCDDALDGLLAAAHHQLGVAVTDRVAGQGGPPELRTPDLALDRLLATTHRSMGAATTRRWTREARASSLSRNPTVESRITQHDSLVSRPPAVRVKYREASLRLMRTYWPFDLSHAMSTAIDTVQHLCELLADTTQPPQNAAIALDTLRKLVHRLFKMPAPYRPPATLTGLDYLTAVRSSLAGPATLFVDGLNGIKEMLDEELTPAFNTVQASGAAYLLGFDTVAQDLVDDLAHGWDAANTLAQAIREVERASNDFIGADLRNVKLDGVLLEGVLWDFTTKWPPHWETRVRRASFLSDEELGVLVVAAEGCDTAVHADA